jgi:hypothetical protein
MFAFQMELND